MQLSTLSPRLSTVLAALLAPSHRVSRAILTGSALVLAVAGCAPAGTAGDESADSDGEDTSGDEENVGEARQGIINGNTMIVDSRGTIS